MMKRIKNCKITELILALTLIVFAIAVSDAEKMYAKEYPQEVHEIHSSLPFIEPLEFKRDKLEKDIETALEKTRSEKRLKVHRELEKRQAFEDSFKSTGVCSLSPVKSYMDLSSITDTSSTAYQLSLGYDLTDDGFYVLHEDGVEYYAVALGSYYGVTGDKFKITLSSGKTFYAVMGDSKADKDTSNGCTHISDGSMIEFIVNAELLKATHDEFRGGLQVYEQWSGYATNIKKME